MKTILDTRFLDCENDDGTLRNKSREMKFELIMLPSEDDIEVSGGSVGTWNSDKCYAVHGTRRLAGHEWLPWALR